MDYHRFLASHARTNDAVKWVQEAFRFAPDKACREDAKQRYDEYLMDLLTFYQDNSWSKLATIGHDEEIIEYVEYFIAEHGVQ